MALTTCGGLNKAAVVGDEHKVTFREQTKERTVINIIYKTYDEDYIDIKMMLFDNDDDNNTCT